MGDIVVRLLLKVLEQLLAELELFSDYVVLRGFVLRVFFKAFVDEIEISRHTHLDLSFELSGGTIPGSWIPK